MNKTSEDFKTQVETKGIEKWIIHNCSLCDYPCGFKFIDGDVFYDSGCYCSYSDLRESSYEDVVEHYELQTNLSVIKEMNEFWGFETKEKSL